MSGFFIQGGFGRQGNFELVLPAAAGGLMHLSRDNDAPGRPWSHPVRFGASIGQVAGASLIQSSFGTPPGNLEVVAVAGNALFHFWRDAAGAWSDPGPPIAAGVSGVPGLVQRKAGNFAVVVPAAAGGLLCLVRDNQAAHLPWSAPSPFAATAGQLSGANVIESSLDDPAGELEVVAIAAEGGRFIHVAERAGPGWSEPVAVGGEIYGGGPGAIQGHFGGRGNFEVVVPSDLGLGLSHYWRDNDAAGSPWKYGGIFGPQTQFLAASIIQSNFGAVGNLEVVAATMLWRQAFHFSRDDNASGFPWSAPAAVLY